MTFRVRWPDDSVSDCYSPSLVIKDFFEVGHHYPLADFVGRSREALTIAGERVKAKFGFYCTGASGQLAEIERRAAAYRTNVDAQVLIERFDE
ncbi:MAG TPA: MSMEG_0570 family nitrogen starvation response protein [Tepidisphaeraceae bacterium]|jgi:uncharacterized repeat protein (TIGR04042 family)